MSDTEAGHQYAEFMQSLEDMTVEEIKELAWRERHGRLRLKRELRRYKRAEQADKRRGD